MVETEEANLLCFEGKPGEEDHVKIVAPTIQENRLRIERLEQDVTRLKKDLEVERDRIKSANSIESRTYFKATIPMANKFYNNEECIPINEAFKMLLDKLGWELWLTSLNGIKEHWGAEAPVFFEIRKKQPGILETENP